MNILINTEPGLEDDVALKVAYLWTEFGTKCEHPLYLQGVEIFENRKKRVKIFLENDC